MEPTLTLRDQGASVQLQLYGLANVACAISARTNLSAASWCPVATVNNTNAAPPTLNLPKGVRETFFRAQITR